MEVPVACCTLAVEFLINVPLLNAIVTASIPKPIIKAKNEIGLFWMRVVLTLFDLWRKVYELSLLSIPHPSSNALG